VEKMKKYWRYEGEKAEFARSVFENLRFEACRGGAGVVPGKPPYEYTNAVLAFDRYVKVT